MNGRDAAFGIRLLIVTLAPAVILAAILFRVFDLRSTRTAIDIVELRQVAKAEAFKRAVDSTPSGSIIWVQAISPADSQRIRAMEATHDSEYYRQWMAGKFAVGGTISLVVLCSLWVFIRKTDSASLKATQPSPSN